MSEDIDLEKPVDEVKKQVRNADNPDIEGLLKRERNGKDRKTLKEFLERRKEDETMNDGVSLNIKQVAGISFGIGLLLGIILGMSFIYLTLPDTEIDQDPPGENGEASAPGEEDSDLEEISDYRYDVEFGVAEENVEWNGVEVGLEGRPYIGSEDADTTIVSFEDFFCPFCVGFHNEEFAAANGMNSAHGEIIENHVETGEARYFYMHFPVQGGDRTAEISECFAEESPEAYYTFVQEHFANYEELAQVAETDPERYEDILVSWGEQLGMDTEDLEACVEDGNPMEVSDQAQTASELGVEASPTTLINGETVEGAQPYSAFEAVIQAE